MYNKALSSGRVSVFHVTHRFIALISSGPEDRLVLSCKDYMEGSMLLHVL